MPKPDKRYHHGDLRRAVLLASLKLIEQSGAEGLSLRQVARQAGVSHGAPYRHFGDKQQLLAAVVEHGFSQLGRALSSASGRSGLSRLQRASVAYVEFALAQPALFRLMFGSAVDRDEHPAAQRAADDTFEALVSILSGVDGIADPRRAARLGWAIVHGIAELSLARQFTLPRAEILTLARQAPRTIVRGLERTQT